MRLVIGLILDRPFFGGVQQHGLVYLIGIEGLAVNQVVNRTEDNFPFQFDVGGRNVRQEPGENRELGLI